ncbi:MAG: hypothetical protein AAB697_00175 [Patescibacteria group bacterium]
MYRGERHWSRRDLETYGPRPNGRGKREKIKLWIIGVAVGLVGIAVVSAVYLGLIK